MLFLDFSSTLNFRSCGTFALPRISFEGTQRNALVVVEVQNLAKKFFRETHQTNSSKFF